MEQDVHEAGRKARGRGNGPPCINEYTHVLKNMAFPEPLHTWPCGRL